MADQKLLLNTITDSHNCLFQFPSNAPEREVERFLYLFLRTVKFWKCTNARVKSRSQSVHENSLKCVLENQRNARVEARRPHKNRVHHNIIFSTNTPLSCPGGGYGVRPRYPSRTLPEPAVTRRPPSGASPRVIHGRSLFRRRRRRRRGDKKRASRRNSPSRIRGSVLVGCLPQGLKGYVADMITHGGRLLLRWVGTPHSFFATVPFRPPHDRNSKILI